MEELVEILRESKGLIDSNLLEKLASRFGKSRVDKAVRSVMEGRVKLYVFKPSRRALWVVDGKGGRRIILPASGYCSCEDFYFNVVEGRAKLCYHIIAHRIATLSGRYMVVELKDRLYDEIVRESTGVHVGVRPRYLDFAEDIRNASSEILSEKGPQPIGVLYLLLSEKGFEIPSKRSLSMILRMDPKGRFTFKNGKWSLSGYSRGY